MRNLHIEIKNKLISLIEILYGHQAHSKTEEALLHEKKFLIRLNKLFFSFLGEVETKSC